MGKMESKLKTLAAHQMDIDKKLKTVNKLIKEKEERWFNSGDREGLFSKTMKEINVIFHDKVGTNWHRGTKDHMKALVTQLKKHPGAYESFQRVQEFFKLVYVSFKDADASTVIKGSYRGKFCSQGGFDKLGDLAKAFIGADDYCSVKSKQ